MSTIEAAKNLVDTCKQFGFRIVTAESCTGGLVASTISSVPGASSVLWGGVVVYDRAAKVALLGLSERGVRGAKVYSAKVASDMARAAHGLPKLHYGQSHNLIALGITGVAGPGPDCGVPAGTVELAVVHTGEENEGNGEVGWSVFRKHIELPNKTRDEVREAVVMVGLEFLYQTAIRQRARYVKTERELAALCVVATERELADLAALGV
jgi:PncC family amidohydrolase